MLSNNQLKHIRSLGVKKYRQEHGQFLVEGDKMVGELLGQHRIRVSAIFALSPWLEKNARFLNPIASLVHSVTEAELSKISSLNTPNQVLAVANLPADPCDASLASSEICFYLDGIQDPGNMGSILRIADWFGFPAVYCSPDCTDVFSPKVVQASMGAIFRVKSWELPLEELLSNLPNLPVAGAVLDGENVHQANLPKHGLLVIGNEGRGISTEVSKQLTHRLCIPRHAAGGAESLNASVAAGILAALLRR
jgi:TrmH family RNA methyltransferase